MTARGLVAAAILIGSLWVGGLVWLIGPPIQVLWGGTTARCKASGFVTGNTLVKADLDCLDTSPRNEFNSQIDANNVKGDAGIQGFKTDQVFSRIVSTQTVVVMAPLLSVTALGSTGTVTMFSPLAVSTLASSGPLVLAAPSFAVSNLSSASAVVIAAPQMTVSSLYSTTLLSVGGSGIVATTLVLQSNNTTGQTPRANTAFANSIPKAYVRLHVANGGPSAAATINRFESFNIAWVTHYATGRYRVMLQTPMLDSSYVVISNITTGDTGESGEAEANRVAMSKIISAYEFNIYAFDGGGAAATQSWSAVVFGRQ